MNKIIQFKILNLRKQIQIILAFIFFIFLFTTEVNADNGIAKPYSVLELIKQKKITLKVTNKPIKFILSEIQKQTNIDFLLKNEKDASELSKLSIDVKNMSVDEVLTKLLANTNFTFSNDGDVIIILRKKVISNSKTSQQTTTLNVEGIVTDKDTRKAMSGVTILIKGTSDGAITDDQGKFKLTLNEGEIIEVSFVGMLTQEIVIKDNNPLKIVLQSDAMQVEDVVVTGYFSRKLDSYTGNATVVKGDDLRAVNPINVMQALAFLDPDIVIQVDNETGSDPNKKSSIHLQGTSSITTAKDQFIDDPNLPTFILDGFEVSYQTIYDMDPTRIESIVVLKDAAATAVYGSRAANGVIVVTTVAPKPGKIELSYNLNLQFSSPDLNSYDLLNAQEKFDLERTFEVKTPNKGSSEYNRVSKWLAGGTDTDWLAQPTRNATTQTHTLNLMGGEKGLRYNLNFNYSDTPGVMKGSERSNYSVTADIIYRPSEKLNFKNSVTYGKNNSKDSPYGNFDLYTKMNPYFPIYDEKGELIKIYETNESDGTVTPFSGENKNPLYTSMDGSFSKSKYTNFIENFSLDWRFQKDFRLTISLAYSETNGQSDHFLSPDAIDFIKETDRSKMGSYTLLNNGSVSFNGKGSIGYIKYIGKHNINANIGGEISILNNESYSHVATGFGSSDLSYMSYAMRYKENSIPNLSEGTTHTLGAYLSVNYTYDNRFLFDGSLRFDGSSQFGSEKRVAPFFSMGIGWNLHNEKFLKNSKVVNLLKIRGSYGQTGSVKFSAYQAKDTYTYIKDNRYMDNLGIQMLAIGNENLKWQKTDAYDIGFNTSLFNNIFSLTASAYYKKTHELLFDVPLPPSSGFHSYVENLGEMENIGYSFVARVSVIRKKGNSLSVFVNGSHNHNNNLSKYKDGKPTTAIEAVYSLGIDPQSGNELYLDRFGNPTWTYNPDDKRIFGNTLPKIQGSFGINGTYKQFQASIGFSYSFGSQEYNSTLENKVENAVLQNNVDRRVLTDTWQKPGDVAKYGHPLGDAIKGSSRFVQDNDYFSLNTFNLTYNFNRDGFIKKVKLSSLQLLFNANDLLHFATIKRERGTSYPFARSFTLGLRANF